MGKLRALTYQLINCLLNSLKEQGNQLDVVYTKIRTAFRRINYSMLFSKLNKIGIHSLLLNWIESYLIPNFAKLIVTFCSFFWCTSR